MKPIENFFIAIPPAIVLGQIAGRMLVIALKRPKSYGIQVLAGWLFAVLTLALIWYALI